MSDSEPTNSTQLDLNIQQTIKQLALDLGFDAVGFSSVDLAQHEKYLQDWLDKGYHGEMDYMQRHGSKRSRPEELVENTCSVISVRMDYLPHDMLDADAILNEAEIAYVSRYALGRDYHKVMRQRLKQLTQQITELVGPFGNRVFTDSAPVLEKALAEKAGLGWIGKHTNLLHEKTGSWFFIGEIYTDLALEFNSPATNHCGSCQKCIEVCPTQAIVAPYQLDARRCISYLTIELKGPIPEDLRTGIGNRIYGCDDCQLVCPWNKFAQLTREKDFTPRDNVTDQELLTLFRWTEAEFLRFTEGSAIRRIGFERWQRNIAVAMGNAPASDKILTALSSQRDKASEMVKEHIDWAIQQQLNRSNQEPDLNGINKQESL